MSAIYRWRFCRFNLDRVSQLPIDNCHFWEIYAIDVNLLIKISVNEYDTHYTCIFRPTTITSAKFIWSQRHRFIVHLYNLIYVQLIKPSKLCAQNATRIRLLERYMSANKNISNELFELNVKRSGAANGRMTHIYNYFFISIFMGLVVLIAPWWRCKNPAKITFIDAIEINH